MFGGPRRPARRFSLLLLDEGEYYVKDFVAHCAWPPEVAGNWAGAARLAGQLRLCTHSLFFEPDDVRVPIVRLPFVHLEQLEGVGERGIAAASRRWTAMKAAAADEPYVFGKGRLAAWRFDLEYSVLADFMPAAQQMLVASRLPPAEREQELDAFLRQLEGALRFDAGHLRGGAAEPVVLDLAAQCLTPLVREPGRLVLTPARLYLQPLHNISGDAAVRSHPLAAVAAVARRRSSLRDTGLEVFFVEPPPEAGVGGPLWGAASAFFAFRTREEREAAVAAVMGQPGLGTALPGGRAAAAACGSILEAGGEWLGRVTAAWQRGRLSNFDYLLYCNLAAGRSFNDLTQYPVFPWVLADYSSPALDLADPAAFRDLSRPVGALSPARLDAFRRRYADMAGDEHRPGGDPPFMYGTHYSCPGYTLHWLVRAAPGHMLRLQTGRFDAPDRLFCGVADAWASALSNPADVKELIPEFFMPGREDVLRNGRHLALGTRQSGRPVGDVELPPWAGGSPEAFLRLQRAALEAPCASANLHHWVDLVFGAKQAGAAAVEADNVFRHLAYEGAVDPQAIADPLERAAVEMAINEFGQCPRQIFRHPHPPRLVCPAPPEPAAAAAAAAEAPAEGGSGQSLSLALVSAIRAATCEDAAPAPSEVPALLRQLDMGRKRQEAADLALARQLQEEQQAAAAAAAAGARGGPPIQPPSPFAAGCNGLMGRLGALKDAVGEAAAAGRAAAAATAAAPAARSEGSGGGLEAAGSAPHSSQPLSSGGRLSSLAGSLSSRWQSFAGSRSASGGGAAPAAQSAAPPAPPSADAPAAESTAASGAGAHQEEPSLPWKFASHGGAARPPACSSDDEAEVGPADGDGPVQGSSRLSDLPGGWGPGLRDRLRPGAALAAGSEAVNALALAAVGDGAFAYCACHDGSLRIFDLAAGRQTRAARLGAQPLASVALLPGAAAAAPLVLCGSYSSEILVYCPATGAPAGAFAPHADAVSCLEVVPGGGDGGGRLVTASWDCSVKVWDLGEGRQPWDSTLPQPAAAAGDLPGGVWALAVAADGATALAGTEEGAVLALDLRSPPAAAVAWERALSRDYIGGVCLLPDGRHALAAAADGALALLDLRRGGATVSAVACGTPLRCCASDGATALAGGEAGGIVVWDVGQQLNRAPPAGAFTPPGIDGLYAPLAAEPASPVNALGVALLEAPGGAGAARLCVASAHESGALRPYWT